MIITRLIVKNFKRFTDKELTFYPAINIIHGKNEQGKSTLAEALLMALYGNPSVHSQVFNKLYTPWQVKGDTVISIEFTEGGKKYLIEKNFTSHKFLMKNLQTHQIFENYATDIKRFYNIFGMQDVNLYKSTAYITYEELTKIHETKSLEQSIREAIVGIGGVKVSDAIKILDKELNELNKGLFAPAKVPGIIKNLTETIKSKEAELSEKREIFEKVKKAAEEKKSSITKSKKIENEIKKLEEEIKNYDLLKSAQKELKNLTEKIDALEKDIQTVKKIQDEINQKIEIQNKYSIFKGANVQEIKRKLSEIRKARSYLDAQLRKKEIEPVFEKPKIGVFEYLFAGGGILFSLIFGLIFKSFLLSFLPAFIGFLISAIYYGYKMVSFTSETARKQEEVKKRVEETIEKIKRLEQKEKDILLRFGAKTFDDFIMRVNRYESLVARIEELNRSLETYLKGKTLSQLEEEQVKLFTKKKEIETSKLTDKVRAADMPEDVYYKKKYQLETLQYELRDLSERKGASEARVKDASVSIDDIVRLEEEIESFRRELSYYERKARVLSISKSGIEEAVDEMVTHSSAIISKGIGEIISIITKGKYTSVKLTPKLHIEVYSKEKNGWVVPDDVLSRGTIDQIYFAFRLSLLRAVSGGKGIPIILDDPFLTFDEERLASTKDILDIFAKEHQIFIFTCRGEYNSWGTLIEI